MTRTGAWCGSSAGARGSVVTCRGSRWCCCRPRGWMWPAIARVAFTSEDRGDLIRNFNADGLGVVF